MTAKRQPESRAAEAPRLVDGRFPRGVSGNPGGVPKGLAEVKELARVHTNRAIDALATIAENGKTAQARIAASVALLDRAWGRPTQPVSGDDDMPAIGLTVEDKEREVEARRQAAQECIATAFAEYVPDRSDA
jgi:hypothetical protein